MIWYFNLKEFGMSIKRYGVEGGKSTGGQHLPFARAVEADGWLYVSGQVPMVQGEVIAGNIVAQSQQAIRNLLSILNEAGCGREHVVLWGFCLKIPATFPHSTPSSKNTSAKIPLRARASYRVWLSTARWRSIAWPTRLGGIDPPMTDHHSIFLLISAFVSVICLILLIAVVKLNPVITLIVIALSLAVVVGMPLATVIHSFEAGVGSTLGHIAIVVALGTMLGKMMAESGGADQIAYTLIRLFGEKNIPWAMVVIGFLVGLPAFFEVGFVLLIPIVFTVVRRTGTSLILVGLPMVAGLSVVHGLVPPHPAALLAVTIYKADLGRTILYALLIGIPTAVIGGPIYAKLIAPHVQLADDNPMAAEFVEHDANRSL